MKILYRATVALIVMSAALVLALPVLPGVLLANITMTCLFVHEAVLIRQRRGFYR